MALRVPSWMPSMMSISPSAGQVFSVPKVQKAGQVPGLVVSFELSLGDKVGYEMGGVGVNKSRGRTAGAAGHVQYVHDEEAAVVELFGLES